MRKIEQQMINAIDKRKAWQLGNTTVSPIDETKSAIYLHGNHIADYWYWINEVVVNVDTLRQWQTPTTKSRLRALGANVTTRKGVTYLNNVAI
jgi:hypothetical protein